MEYLTHEKQQQQQKTTETGHWKKFKQTVSMAALGKLQSDRVQHIWIFQCM